MPCVCVAFATSADRVPCPQPRARQESSRSGCSRDSRASSASSVHCSRTTGSSSCSRPASRVRTAPATSHGRRRRLPGGRDRAGGSPFRSPDRRVRLARRRRRDPVRVGVRIAARRRTPASRASGSWTTSGRSRCSGRRGTTCSRATPRSRSSPAHHRAGAARHACHRHHSPNVAQLGKIVATLDVLSGGRAAVRLGVGWFAAETQHSASPFPPLGERYALLEDALEFLPVFWGKGAPAFEGRVLHVPGGDVLPAPAAGARTHPRRGRTASGAPCAWRPGTRTRATSSEKPTSSPARSTRCGTHCEQAGRSGGDVEVTQLSTTLVGTGHARLAALLERLRPRRTSAEDYASACQRRHRRGSGRSLPGARRGRSADGDRQLSRPRRRAPDRTLPRRHRRLPPLKPRAQRFSTSQRRDRMRHTPSPPRTNSSRYRPEASTIRGAALGPGIDAQEVAGGARGVAVDGDRSVGRDVLVPSSGSVRVLVEVPR